MSRNNDAKSFIPRGKSLPYNTSNHNELERMISPQYRAVNGQVRFADESGSVTAEYVIATLAAVSFAGLLVIIMRGDEVRTILVEMVRNALQFPG